MPNVTLIVNGQTRTVAVRDPDEPLLYVLRNALKLTGAKFGCGLGQCGACTVLVDGNPVRSCSMPVSSASGKKVTTIEGLGTPDKPHPLQAAFIAEQAAQCGYCVNGMVMSGAAALARKPDLTRADAQQALAGNLCRCGTHERILQVMARAADEEGDMSARGLTGHAHASNHASAVLARRAFLQAGGALVVGFMLPGAVLAQRGARADAAIGKTLDTGDVDGFIAVNADGSVTIYSGKVDLGQGLRIAIPQMAAEELGIRVERIVLIEGDTAFTPDQGATAGSSGIVRGGVQIRQAAATAREALIALAAARAGKASSEFDAIDGEVRPKSGGAGIRYADLIAGKHFSVKVDPKAKLRDPASYTVVGKALPRPDIPGKVTGQHVFIHDFTVEGMLHGRVIRPPAVGAKLVDVDEASIAAIPGARVVRIANFIAVVADDEWDAVSAARMLKARWSPSAPLVSDAGVRAWMRTARSMRTRHW